MSDFIAIPEPATPEYPERIRMIMPGEEATGGPAGPENLQAEGLARRTQWLKENKEDVENKGKPGGYAPLDAGGKVPGVNLPDSPVVNNMNDGATDKAPSVAAVNAALQGKVDKTVGKGLSTEDYTTAEKAKLAGLESSHFRGQFASFAELRAIPGGMGDYAYVDEGAGRDVTTYIWDASDSKWVDQKGLTTAETPAAIKSKYESNPDTNAYTDAEKSKLSGVAAGATADTAATIKSKYESNSNTNAFTDAEKNKLSKIPIEALAAAQSPSASNPVATIEDVNKVLSTTARNLYVSVSGNDSVGDGTTAKPFATVSKALSTLPKHLNCTVTIYIGPGTYTLSAQTLVQCFSGSGTIGFYAQDMNNKPLFTNTPGTLNRDATTGLFHVLDNAISVYFNGLRFKTDPTPANSANSGVAFQRSKQITITACEFEGFRAAWTWTGAIKLNNAGYACVVNKNYFKNCLYAIHARQASGGSSWSNDFDNCGYAAFCNQGIWSFNSDRFLNGTPSEPYVAAGPYPYYSRAETRSLLSNITTVPVGAIIFWSNAATIPAGWRICDGTNGTPNLLGNFPKFDRTPLTKGGANTKTLSAANLPSHSHTFTGASHTHTGPSHTHTFTGTAHVHTIGSHTHTGPSHTHVIGNHSHTFSASTSSGGIHHHAIGNPYWSGGTMAESRMAVYNPSSTHGTYNVTLVKAQTAHPSWMVFKQSQPSDATANNLAYCLITMQNEAHAHSISGSVGNTQPSCSASGTGASGASTPTCSSTTATGSISAGGTGNTGSATQGGTIGNTGSGAAFDVQPAHITLIPIMYLGTS